MKIRVSAFTVALAVATILPGPCLRAQTYYANDFETDAVGARPAGDFTFSPSTNTAINGAVIVDATSTPANPLAGKALYVYDLGGSSGQNTHMRADFNGGTNVSNLRVDFDFQRAYAASDTDTDTRIHFAVGRAGVELNSSANRPFEVRVLNNGEFVVHSWDGTAATPTTVGPYLTDAPNHLTLLVNSHDNTPVDYFDPALGSVTVPTNSFLAFLNGVRSGPYEFNVTAQNFLAEDNDLGRFAFYQDTSRQGGIVFDNVVLRSLLAPVSTVPAPSGLAGLALSSTSIRLTWVDNATNETDYLLERKSAGGEFAVVASLPADTVEFTDMGLTPETAYIYRVIAKAAAVESDPSNQAAVTTPQQIEPLIVGQTAPSLVVAGDGAAVSVTVLGQAPFTYQWYTGPTGDTSSPIGGATQATLNLTVLTATTNAWVRVTNASGSADSATITINVRASVRTVVTNATELNAAIAAAGPGDEILLRDGTWNDRLIQLTGTGTAAHPITLGAETPGAVVLTGSSRVEIGGTYLVVRDLRFEGLYSGNDDEVIQFRRGSSNLAHNCRLTNVSIIGYTPASGERTFWVSLYGTYNRVDHCYFARHNVSGVTVVAWLDGNPNFHRIDHNHFADRIFGGENGWETIRIGTSEESLTSSRTTVDYNLFTRVDGEIETISNKSGDNIYRYNTFVACEGTLTLRHGDRCIVDSNTFIGLGRSRTGGVRVIGEDHIVINNHFEGTTARDGAAITVYSGVANSPLNGYFAAHRATIAFNTFVDNTGPAIEVGTGLGGSNRTVLPTGIRVANNLMARTQAGGSAFVGGPGTSGQAWTNNLIHNAAAGITAAGGFVTADPGLAWNALRQLTLPAATGPVAHAATRGIITVALDIEGRARGALQDTGAHEVSSGAAPLLIGPVTAVVTGPSYLGPERLPGVANARLVNHSVRAVSGTGDAVLIHGFVIGGLDRKSLLVRAVGPGLAPFGVVDPMPRPTLELFSAAGVKLAANAGWETGPGDDLIEAAAVAGAFPLENGALDSALLTTLAPGPYTALVSPADGKTGPVLLEVYDLTQGKGTLVNQSARGQIGQGQDVLITGLVVGGTASRRVLVRAAGPALAGFGVSGAIADPRLELFNADGQAIAANDAWSSGSAAAAIEAAAAEAGAFPFASGSADAALLAALSPGVYSVHASGAAGVTGTVLIEVYLLAD